MSGWKETVTRRFDAAAGTYEEGAAIQRRIAQDLRQRILDTAPPSDARVLEIGCGTGFLTAALLPDLPDCRWIATDISPRMVELCSARGYPRVACRVMDGERPDLDDGDFDLVVSNMTVQWFAELGASLERLHALLRPGGLLAVTTLGSGTFQEWGEVCRACGVDPATPKYPSPAALEALLGPGAVVLQRAWPLPCDSLHGFLAHLKATGARAAAPGQPPLSPGALRRILRTWAGRTFTTTYDVLTVLWRKGA